MGGGGGEKAMERKNAIYVHTHKKKDKEKMEGRGVKCL